MWRILLAGITNGFFWLLEVFFGDKIRALISSVGTGVLGLFGLSLVDTPMGIDSAKSTINLQSMVAKKDDFARKNPNAKGLLDYDGGAKLKNDSVYLYYNNKGEAVGEPSLKMDSDCRAYSFRAHRKEQVGRWAVGERVWVVYFEADDGNEQRTTTFKKDSLPKVLQDERFAGCYF